MREHFYENSCWLKAFETRLCSEIELFFKNLSDSIKVSVFRVCVCVCVRVYVHPS